MPGSRRSPKNALRTNTSRRTSSCPCFRGSCGTALFIKREVCVLRNTRPASNQRRSIGSTWRTRLSRLGAASQEDAVWDQRRSRLAVFGSVMCGVDSRHGTLCPGTLVAEVTVLCLACGLPLRRSIYSNNLKACPGCSGRTGRHVFYEKEAFGWRTPSKTGVTIIQSHCSACRANRLAVITVAARC